MGKVTLVWNLFELQLHQSLLRGDSSISHVDKDIAVRILDMHFEEDPVRIILVPFIALSRRCHDVCVDRLVRSYSASNICKTRYVRSSIWQVISFSAPHNIPASSCLLEMPRVHALPALTLLLLPSILL
eukprot:750000-Hanusia_phi.AAC.4